MSQPLADASLFSPHWYRVAELRPRLPAQVQVQRHYRREQRWYRLIDPLSQRVHRLNAAAYAFVGRCNGQLCTREVWEALAANDAASLPTQDEIVALLATLYRANLIQFDVVPDFAAILRDRRQRKRQTVLAQLNPLALRIPLLNPDALLGRLEHVCRPVFSVWGLRLIVASLLGMLALAFVLSGEIMAYARQWLLTPQYLLLMALVYPVMKLLHELAHGVAVRHWGGEVAKMGITLLMLMPVPFVDASAANAFREARHRLAVSAAGVVVELLLASLGLLAWWLLQPGLLHDLGFVTFFVGVFSSLLVNGNPLLQFDGYFVLCDALGLPNLGSRSSLWWGERCARELGGSRAPVVEPAKGERFWLVAYFPLSLTYRIWLSFTVVAWLGGYYFLLGLLAALLMAHSLLLKPLRSLLLDLSRGAGRQGAAWRRRLLWLPLIVLALPLPSATVVQGVVWVPEQATARAGVDGFVAALPVADGQPVQAGQTLVRLDDENLLAEREKLLGQLRAQESQFFGQLRLAPERAQEFATAMARTQSELALTEQRIADLEVRAGRAGRFVMPAQADRLGRLIGRGDVLGYVVDAAAPLVVRVALPHEQAVLVREQTQRINVVLADAPEQTWTAQASGVVSAATLDLPSAALGVNSGGEIVTDPADNKHLRSREPVVLLDVQVADAPSARIGTRAQVRFAHGWAPLAEQLLRRAQQMWLRHVNPAE